MARLLVVDDEPNVLYSIKKGFQTDSLTVDVAQSGRQALERIRQTPPDAVILDVRLGDMSGLEVFDQIRKIDSRLPVILMTAYATTETAIEAMKRGAFDHLVKPVELSQLREVVQRALELSHIRHVRTVFGDEEQAEDSERIVGRSPTMQEVYKAIGRVAPRDVTVLIVGESGTGKELVARAIFHHSSRTAAPFLEINCAAIPETLLESELFGHERGSFTGADRRRIGKFEQAHLGTLFLDEIGDMSAATQAKMLRLIQEQRFERVGGNDTIQTDVRLIAATNKNLDEEVLAGRFRKDLFYRLNVFTIRVPPLRERREDIPLLIEHFLPRFSRSLGRNLPTIAPEAQLCLQTYDWPGNVRQLQSVLKYAIVQAPGDAITLDCLPEDLRIRAVPSDGPPKERAEISLAGLRELTETLLRAGEMDIYRRVCQEMDQVVLATVLRHVKGNQVKASELLGISRTTLRAKLRALRLGNDKLTFGDAVDGEKDNPLS
jgi:two-component system nitrogen regulation response regulator GlnG